MLIDLVSAWFCGWIQRWQVLLEKQVCFLLMVWMAQNFHRHCSFGQSERSNSFSFEIGNEQTRQAISSRLESERMAVSSAHDCLISMPSCYNANRLPAPGAVSAYRLRSSPWAGEKPGALLRTGGRSCRYSPDRIARVRNIVTSCFLHWPCGTTIRIQRKRRMGSPMASEETRYPQHQHASGSTNMVVHGIARRADTGRERRQDPDWPQPPAHAGAESCGWTSWSSSCWP